jgi:drug/metabolite transporter (DMT)-like permease
MEKPRVSYPGLGLILGSAVGFAFGMILYTSTGEPMYILVGLVGTALGLILGAGVDHNMRQS